MRKQTFHSFLFIFVFLYIPIFMIGKNIGAAVAAPVPTPMLYHNDTFKTCLVLGDRDFIFKVIILYVGYL